MVEQLFDAATIRTFGVVLPILNKFLALTFSKFWFSGFYGQKLSENGGGMSTYAFYKKTRWDELL